MSTTHDQPVHDNARFTMDDASDVGRLYLVFVNLYFVGARGEPWVLVDSGLPHAAGRVMQHAAARYGPKSRPEAIILTHGHFDHAGNALELARAWSVPVYAHPLEHPYLTDQSDYPPSDPTVGGALGLMSRAFPSSRQDLGDRLHPLPSDGSVPGAPGWRWLHTPGHTAGHVSLFRDADRFLIAGDALATVNQDSPLSMLNLRDELSVPPAPLTTDWEAGRTSVEQLAALRPRSVAAGHGRPVQGERIADDLAHFSATFAPPRGGRYSARPAITNEHGLVSVPPPVADALPAKLLVGGLMAGAAYLALLRGRDE
ncbi:MAG: MBL fold metallo-hydrolase [Gemmatimonadaceae bacterium]|nr:MBL fold metallo-hydrolase [Gemmatimonadaceae bacterium]